jgi:hypothetical protein
MINKLYEFIDIVDENIINKRKNVIGIIDADLNDNGTNFPNLALMKISYYWKQKGYTTKLLLNYDDVNYEKIYLSKVFTKTKIPIPLNKFKNIEYGGTGFGLNNKDLPKEIEFSRPDYDLYLEYVKIAKEKYTEPKKFVYYTDYSIGFLTRGCFRKCDFCVNKKYNKVVKWSNLEDFYDPKRKYISLCDDNFLGYGKWKEELDKLNSTGKKFIFKQGLDIRLLTEYRVNELMKSNYIGKFIFAFDHYEDKESIEKKLKLFKNGMIKYKKKLRMVWENYMYWLDFQLLIWII